MTLTGLDHVTAVTTKTDLPCTWRDCGSPVKWIARVPCCGATYDWCDYHKNGLLAKATLDRRSAWCPRCGHFADVLRITWTARQP